MTNHLRYNITEGRHVAEIIDDALFNHGYLHGSGRFATPVAAALADRFGIDIVKGIKNLDMECIRVAARNLGFRVPEPFYRGFPDSVVSMSQHALLVDQLINYLVTYGFDHFDGPSSHSLLETVGNRDKFAEHYEIKPFIVVSDAEAIDIVKQLVNDTLSATRPASNKELALALAVIETYGLTCDIACADTRVMLAAAMRNPAVTQQLRIGDILKLAELLEDTRRTYAYENRIMFAPRTKPTVTLKKLNLSNQDRKLLTSALDGILSRGLSVPEKFNVFERQADWCGLLHHIHYHPTSDNARAFVDAMRSMSNHSHMSKFEKLMASGDTVRAAKYLAKAKGQGTLLRHIDYILSRATSDAEIDQILAALDCKDAGQLIQLILHTMTVETGNRTFAFPKNGLMVTHIETPEEAANRGTKLDAKTRQHVADRAMHLLMDTCAGRLGNVYVGSGMDRIAIETSSAASNAGFATLPRGSRIPLDGRTIRAFTYWEKVHDIDLALMGLADDGSYYEFSWRTMYRNQSNAITFSGDVTDGYDGGSEYFDINIDAVRKLHPDLHYLVLTDNVYTGKPFDDCSVRAGYMLREKPNSGEVFEPKTVKTSFAVTGNSTFSYMFAIDLVNAELIWLNMSRASYRTVAGAEGRTAYDFLTKWFDIVDTISLGDVASLCATRLVTDVRDADIAFVMDRSEVDPDLDIEVVTPSDVERVRALLS